MDPESPGNSADCEKDDCWDNPGEVTLEALGLRGCGDGKSSSVGGLSAGRNKLAMPETMIPGCSPRKGESNDIVPRIRCLNWLPWLPGYE